MPETRLIDANKAQEYLYEHLDDLHLAAAMNAINEMPTVDAVPVKRGHWIDVDYKTIEHGFIETYPNEGVCCSECRTGFKKSRQLIRNFCPNCGAKMDGDADDGQGKSD